MGERLGRAGRRLLATFLSALRLAISLPGQIPEKLTVMFSWLSDKIHSPSGALARFRGRSRVRARLENIQQQPFRGGRSPYYDQEFGRRPITRFTTAVVTAGLLLVVAFMTSQNRQQPLAAGSHQSLLALYPPTGTPQPKPSETPTATPSPTPSPTPTIQPSPAFQEAAGDLAAWPTPDPLGKGGTLAFTVRNNGNGDIYAVTIGRSKPIQLTDHPADDRDPAWSPDGRQLAFSSKRDGNWEIYILDLASEKIKRLTNDKAFDAAPRWSPDGEWLVYESYREGNLDLYIVASSGENPPIRLTEHPAHDFSPAWGPDGRHIAFSSWRSGNKDIFIMSLDTPSDEQSFNVTASPGKDEDQPSFSPDGEFLAYYDDSSGFELVHLVPLAGYLPKGEVLSVGQGSHPSWSADGQSLVYLHHTGGQSFVIASGVDAWNVAPQAYAHQGRLDDLDWSAVILPRRFGNGQDTGSQTTLQVIVPDEGIASEDGGATFLLREVDVEAPAAYLSDRVDDSFKALRQKVLDEAGWDFLGQVDNMFTFLSAKPFPGETGESWSKAARAFDFYHRYPISVDPQVEVVREDRGNQTFWRVYLRTADQTGAKGEPLRQMPWDFTARYGADPRYYDEGGKEKETIPPGYYLDFTSLAEDFGWTRVPALDSWRTFFQGIRYWHFENRGGLSWKEAILELYTEDELDQVFETP